MSPKPAIILHNALLREFYMACDRCCEIWGVRIWHPLISERQILKQTLKWAISPLLFPLSFPAEIWNIKGSESPSAFKRGKLSAPHSWWDFENGATWRQSVSTGTSLVTVTESCHFTAPALMETDIHHPPHLRTHYVTSCRPAEQYVSLKICWKTRSGRATSAFCALIAVILK